MATTLSKYGINLNLAPVADVNLNPDNPIIARLNRSFSHDTEEIATHCTAFIEAHHRRGVACCLKHFPGHGSACGDSHLGFVDITHDWQELELPAAALGFTWCQVPVIYRLEETTEPVLMLTYHDGMTQALRSLSLSESLSESLSLSVSLSQSRLSWTRPGPYCSVRNARGGTVA